MAIAQTSPACVGKVWSNLNFVLWVDFFLSRLASPKIVPIRISFVSYLNK